MQKNTFVSMYTLPPTAGNLAIELINLLEATITAPAMKYCISWSVKSNKLFPNNAIKTQIARSG